MPLRLSDLQNARTVDALDRLFGREPAPDPQAVARYEARNRFTDAELLAFFTIKRSPLTFDVAAALRKEGATLTSEAFRSLRERGFARRGVNGFHELTGAGAARVDMLACEAAKARGLHILIYGYASGHRYERGRNTVRCTCGWGVSTGRSGSGEAGQKHLDAVAAALPVVADAPAITPEDSWRSLGEIVADAPSIVPEGGET